METPTQTDPPVASTDLFGWVRTADRLPGANAGDQTNVLMWSPEWATWLKGMVTLLDGNTSCEWSLYDQENDRYHVWEHIPEFWLSPSLPNVKEHATPLAGAGVETGVGVHATGDVDDRAASGVAVARLVRLSD